MITPLNDATLSRSIPDQNRLTLALASSGCPEFARPNESWRLPHVLVLVLAAITAALCAACYGGVPASDVQLEATQIKKNAEMAQTLHVRCLDAGAGAAPAVIDALCTAEMRALADIEQNADALLKKAGPVDGGGGS
ncbi:MAG: hypothetical protein ACLQVI_11245 [Polyangiaceae bacterium]